MTDGSEDVPAWARPLFDGPISVDELTDGDDLTFALEKRLVALLELYNCDASPHGWRSLALRLALEHEIGGKPVMKVMTPVDRQPLLGGAEPGATFWTAMRMRKKEKELGSAKAAAVALSRSEGVSARRLQNVAADTRAGRISKPRFVSRLPWEAWIRAALSAAADRLEAKSRG